MITAKVEGLAELRHALYQLPEELRAGPRRKAVTAAAIVVREDSKSRVPILKKPDKRRKPGTLRNAIRTGWSKLDSSRVQDTVNVYVNALSRGSVRKFKQRTGKSSADNPDDAFYWKVWEFGNGVNSSHSFLRPAFDAKWRSSITVMGEALRKAIGRAVEKLRWKTSKS